MGYILEYIFSFLFDLSWTEIKRRTTKKEIDRNELDFNRFLTIFNIFQQVSTDFNDPAAVHIQTNQLRLGLSDDRDDSHNSHDRNSSFRDNIEATR